MKIDLLRCSCGGSAAFVAIPDKRILIVECGACRRSGLPVDLAAHEPSDAELQAAARSWNINQQSTSNQPAKES